MTPSATSSGPIATVRHPPTAASSYSRSAAAPAGSGSSRPTSTRAIGSSIRSSRVVAVMTLRSPPLDARLLDRHSCLIQPQEPFDERRSPLRRPIRPLSCAHPHLPARRESHPQRHRRLLEHGAALAARVGPRRHASYHGAGRGERLSPAGGRPAAGRSVHRRGDPLALLAAPRLLEPAPRGITGHGDD